MGDPGCRGALWHLVPQACPGVLAPENQRAYLLNVEASMCDECLTVELKYSANCHAAATIQRLASMIMNQVRSAVLPQISKATVIGETRERGRSCV
jgi:hypothetical protein